MADIRYPVNVALAEVPVNKVPLVDATDFKTIEDAVAYDAAGMALRWHFVTPDGAYTVTSVTPTTAGNYDWTDQGDSGIYTIEIPASGGASINNDTEGYGWFTGVATGILPWCSPIFEFGGTAVRAYGVASGTPTVDSIPTSLLVPAAAAGKYAGQWLVFRHDTATAALQGVKVLITHSAADGVQTTTPCPVACASGDKFDIYP